LLVERKSTALKRKLLFYLLILAAALGAWFYADPLSLYDIENHIALKQAGVSVEMYGPFETYNQQHCTTDLNCQCYLFIHGLGDRALTWRKVFTDWTQGKPQEFKLFAPNLRSAGKSQRPENKNLFRVTAQADELYQTFKGQCEKFNIVGNSLGGWIAMQLAIRHPNFVNKLILLGPAGYSGDFSDIAEVFAHPNSQSLRDFHKKTYYSTPELPSFVYQRLAERLARLPLVDLMKAQTPDDFVDKTAKSINAPTHLIWGDGDQIIPRHFIDKFRSDLPLHSFDYIKECGHVIQKECPEALFKVL
jgi:pimeloyl-ACP methyl ester carboxylesterase